MSDRFLVGDYRPGDSMLHRLPPGPKLLGLTVLSIGFVVARGVMSAVLLLALTLVLAALARLPLRLIGRATRGILLIALALAVVQGWLHGWARAVETSLDLLALAIASLLLTTTTSVNAMLDTLLRLARPLRRVGVSPDRVALTFALAIQSIPAAIGLLRETRDAARARGLRSPRVYLTPFVIRVVARAHETGDALQARGIGDD